MALVKLVDESEAEGLVAEVYRDILESRGLAKVPNFWKALANRPEYLAATWAKLKTVMGEGAIDRKTKEMIAVGWPFSVARAWRFRTLVGWVSSR